MGRKKHKNAMKNVDWKTVRFLQKRAMNIDPAKHFNPWKYCKELEEKMQQIKSTRNCKYMLNFHIVWCLRGRVKILFLEARNLLTEIIEAICKESKWTPYAIEVMPDHVHLFLGTKDFREKVVGKLKGISSSHMFRCFPIFKKALSDGHLWSRSYYISSIGNISGKTLLNYLAKQWKEFGDPRYELAMATLHKGQTTILKWNPS